MNADVVGKYEMGKTTHIGTSSTIRLAAHVETRVNYEIERIMKAEAFWVPGARRGGGSGMTEDGATDAAAAVASRVFHSMAHPNIICLKEVLQCQTMVFFVTESSVVADEMIARMEKKNKGFGEGVARKYVTQLLDALRYLHSHGFSCCGDVDVDSLLIEGGEDEGGEEGTSSSSSGGGDLKLRHNFGLPPNPRFDSNALKTSMPRSPQYLPPELTTNGDGTLAAAATPAADMWSCGVILFVMLTGCLPFVDGHVNGAKLIDDIRTATFEVPDDVSGEAADLIRRLLVPDPDGRLTAERALAHPWLQQQQQQQDAPPPHVPSSTARDTGGKTDYRPSPPTQVRATTVPEPGKKKVLGPLGTAPDQSPIAYDAFTLIEELATRRIVALDLCKSGRLCVRTAQINDAIIFEGSAHEGLLAIYRALDNNNWRPVQKEETGEVRAFQNTPKGLFAVGARALPTIVGDCCTPFIIWLSRGDEHTFAAEMTIIKAFVRDVCYTYQWSWRTHVRCSAHVRCAVLCVFSGLTHWDSKRQVMAVVPSEVAYEICSYFKAPYL